MEQAKLIFRPRLNRISEGKLASRSHGILGGSSNVRKDENNLKVWLKLSRNLSLKNFFKISVGKEGGGILRFYSDIISYSSMKMRHGKLGIVVVKIFFLNRPLVKLEHVLSHLLVQDFYCFSLHGIRANMIKASFESFYLFSHTQEAVLSCLKKGRWDPKV